MLGKRLLALGITMVFTISLLSGCGAGDSETISEDTTKIVQVTKVDGTTITANVGELSSEPKDMQGDAPPEGAPDGSDKKGEPPAGKPGGNRFTSTGESITFTITDATIRTTENNYEKYLSGRFR